MLRKLLLGLSAAATLGAAAIASTPVAAQPFDDGYYDGPRWGGGYDRPYYGYGRPPGYGYGYGRPYDGPRCFYRPVRYWDGWGWVVRERRVCR